MNFLRHYFALCKSTQVYNIGYFFNKLSGSYKIYSSLGSKVKLNELIVAALLRFRTSRAWIDACKAPQHNASFPDFHIINYDFFKYSFFTAPLCSTK